MASEDVDLLAKYPDMTVQEHIRSKDMWAGSSSIDTITDYIWRDGAITPTWEQSVYPPALYKTFDELIVNAADHRVKTGLVTHVNITYTSDGVFTIQNDGPGIEIEKHPLNGMYIPQIVFGVLFKGSNLKAATSIVGGTHGVGAKLSNAFSKWFEVETVDKRKKINLKYTQRWTDGMNTCMEPVIVPATGTRYPYTKVSFLPDYFSGFKWDQQPPALSDLVTIMTSVLRMRATKLSMYLGYVSSGKCTVTFNNTIIPIMNSEGLAKVMFPHDESVRIESSSDAVDDPFVSKYYWDVSVVLRPVISTGNYAVKANAITCVNGVAVAGGAHLEYILDRIVDSAKEQVTKELGGKNVRYRSSYITDTIVIIATCQIPGVKWEGQRKDDAKIPTKTLKKFTLSDKAIAVITKHAVSQSLAQIYMKSEKSSDKRQIGFVDKYTPAEYGGTKRADECYLMLAEGDSAITILRKGITAIKPGETEPALGFKKYGILSLGGVIINARKKSKQITIDGEERHILSQQLANNKFMKSFMEVMGLKTTYRYDPDSPSFKREWSELRYRGGIVICVDQDHAGEGFICSLILNFIALYWPGLFKVGMIKRFMTPYLRAYPNRNSGEVFEFTSPAEFRKWQLTHDESMYTLKYIKGLGTNEDEDVFRLFYQFERHVYTFKLDDESLKMFGVYFGKESEPRKDVLRNIPGDPPDILLEFQQRTHEISASDHLRYKMTEHMSADIIMKLWHSIDGLNESGRKITHAVRRIFYNSSAGIKVSRLAGMIAEHEEYHYGEQSLWANIIGKAYIVVGGVQLPVLLPLGQFGTRNKSVGNSKDGTKSKVKDDNASPRYIYTLLNKKLSNVLYPREDDALLDYVVSEGMIVEPKYYVPIVPPIYESTEIPSEGWKIKMWARDIFDIINSVRILIKYPRACNPRRMRPYTYGHKGSVRYIRGEPYSVGNYWYDESENTIRITELPLRVWTAPYAEYIRKKKSTYVKEVIDHSSGTAVNIRCILHEGAITNIEAMADGMWADGVEEYLELRARMDSHINMISPDGGVKSFTSYEEVLRHWFPFRRDLYRKRIDRRLCILRLHILHLKEVERFLQIKATIIDSTETPEPIVASRLQDNRFPRLYMKMINQPELTPTDQIERNAVNSDKASYDYLVDLTHRDGFTDNCIRRRQLISKYENEIQSIEQQCAIDTFPGASIWLQELDELEAVVKEGRMTDWKFGRNDKLVYKK